MALRQRNSANLPVLVKSASLTEQNYQLLRQCSQTFNNLSAKAMNEIRSIPSGSKESVTFTEEDLEEHLYGKNKVEKIDLEEVLKKRKLLEDENPNAKRSRILSENSDGELDNIEMTYSITSFPNDVQLSYSSIPGHKLGVCATKLIPVGAWMGPYEGKRVSTPNANGAGYCWEVYKDGKLDHFLDGSDKHSSSWMRYVRCARNKEEQNMYVIQFGPNIFYRAFKEIKPGEELLVWYENQYEQYLGIPMFIKLSSFALVPRNDTIKPGAYHSQQSTKEPNLDNNSSSAYHNDLLTPPHINETFTSNIHYGNYTRQDSLGNLSPPLSASPVASPTAMEHMPIVHDPNADRDAGMWQCGQCTQKFTQRSALRLHVCPCQADNPYHCGHCNISFSDPTKLRDHVLTHETKRPFKCGFCSRTFAGATTLNNHVRTHTGQKPFMCEKCGKSFSQASQVSRHQRIAEDCN